MSHEIPGFRQTYKWFPNEIYYSATAKQVEAYCNSRESDLPNGDTAQGPMSSTYEATASAHSGTWQTSSSKQQRGWDELQEVLRKQQETFQKQDQKQNQTIEGLKNDMELRHAELLNQLLIQREIYEHQNTELRKQLATLLEMTEDLARG
ncbi:hypothetical protein BGX28_010057 [Mortierella sp. GBA30]|nr:hypothetical protein BGX28_010057 [Mortierella sp. GBA30]